MQRAAEPMDKVSTQRPVPGQSMVQDLGGPTPENYTNSPDDDSAKLKDASCSPQACKGCG